MRKRAEGVAVRAGSRCASRGERRPGPVSDAALSAAVGADYSVSARLAMVMADIALGHPA